MPAKMLIVDDEESVIMSLNTALQSHGINNVVSCQDSRDVMDLVRGNDLEVILLDLTMPHISGNVLLSEIIDSYPQIPVIIVTYFLQRWLKAGYLAGAIKG